MDAKGQLAQFKGTIAEYKRVARDQYERRVQALDAALAVAEEMAQNRQPVEVMSPKAVSVQVRRADPMVEQPVREITRAVEQDAIWEDSQERNGGSKRFKLKDEVERAYKEFKGVVFRQVDVTNRLREKFPEQTVYAGSVSATLGKLVSEGKIVMVKESGGGSDPALYQEVNVSP